MKWFRALAAASVICAATVVVAGPDEEYISIYQVIEEADQSMANNSVAQARARYSDAQEALKKFKAAYPSWNDKAVEFRLQYVTERLGKLGPASAAAPAAPSPKALPLAQPASVDPVVDLRQQVARLQEDNKVLNAKLTEALAAQPAAIDPRELQKAEAQITSLQKEKELLKVALEQEQAKVAKASDKSGLEAAQKEIATLRGELAKGAAPVVASERAVEEMRERVRTNELAVVALQLALKNMKEERDAVLARASAQSAAAPAPAPSVAPKGAAADDQTTKQLSILRARLAVLEARKVPYTTEELALMKQGPLAAKAPPAKGESKKKELPAGAGFIITQAQQAFAAKRYAEAELKYQEILKIDDKNVFTLGNLGLIQMEMGRLGDAEATLTKAQAIDPDDSFVLAKLGILRFRQNKFDEALDLLSRAADLDPKDPEIQNYLGITLSEKGMRIPAETALRKAIELNPNYPVAHHNLAVVYATQKPPFLELARYHYQKAIDRGHPADPAVEKLINAKP